LNISGTETMKSAVADGQRDVERLGANGAGLIHEDEIAIGDLARQQRGGARPADADEDRSLGRQ
jgi:hypothetical protein